MSEKKSTAPRRLYRSGVDKKIAGICGGFADYFAIDVTLVRILWVISIFIHGIGLIGYFVALIVIPENPDHAGMPRKQSNGSKNSGLIVGVILIVLGIIFLSREFYWPIYDILGPFTFYSGRFWPILLILFGVLYLVHVMKQDKDADSKTEESDFVPEHQAKKLTRSRTDKMIGGVCGGLAKYWSIDTAIVRVAYALISVLSAAFPGIIVYIVLLIAIPEESPDEISEAIIVQKSPEPEKNKTTTRKTSAKTRTTRKKAINTKEDEPEQE